MLGAQMERLCSVLSVFIHSFFKIVVYMCLVGTIFTLNVGSVCVFAFLIITNQIFIFFEGNLSAKVFWVVSYFTHTKKASLDDILASRYGQDLNV